MAKEIYDSDVDAASANWTRPGVAGHRRFRELNRPPQNSSWAWMTAEMLCSPAWGALTDGALKFIMRVVAEHLAHGGVANGKLPVTYADLREIGLHADKARRAILVAIELGFIDKAPQLVRPRNIRAPNLYRITWFPGHDGSAPTNRWMRLQTRADALKAVSLANAKAATTRKPRDKRWAGSPRTPGRPVTFR